MTSNIKLLIWNEPDLTNLFWGRSMSNYLSHFSSPHYSSGIQLKRNINAPVAIRNHKALSFPPLAHSSISHKQIVFEETSKDDIWWVSVNMKMDEHEFASTALLGKGHHQSLMNCGGDTLWIVWIDKQGCFKIGGGAREF